MKISKPTSMKIIARPEDFDPSQKDSKVIGTFNPGVSTIETKNGLETLLLVRVAETFKENNNSIYVPRWDYKNKKPSLIFDKIEGEILNESDKEIKYIDSKGEVKTKLKHASHPEIRILNKTGKLEKWGQGNILPKYDFEEYGIEDTRITKFEKEVEKEIGYKYCITSVVPHDIHRVSTVMMLTNDFKKFNYLPFGNTPRPIKNGKDIALFPDFYLSPDINIRTKKREKKFVMFVRPSEHNEISPAGIAIEYSHNLTEMGIPHRLIENQNGAITGTGAPPLKLGNILLSPYHEAIPYNNEEDGKKWHTHYYVTKLLELDAKEPWKASIIPNFCLRREDFNEILPDKGFVPNVVYTTGMTANKQGNKLKCYNGIDDTWIVETEHDID